MCISVLALDWDSFGSTRKVSSHYADPYPGVVARKFIKLPVGAVRPEGGSNARLRHGLAALPAIFTNTGPTPFGIRGIIVVPEASRDGYNHGGRLSSKGTGQMELFNSPTFWMTKDSKAWQTSL